MGNIYIMNSNEGIKVPEVRILGHLGTSNLMNVEVSIKPMWKRIVKISGLGSDVNVKYHKIMPITK